MTSEIEQRNMEKESPILVRIFKEESELEIWKEDKTGRFALLKTYPICRWSGELGPIIKQGDRQAPEGFYTITPGLMNPNSNYYLAINIGFPNAYDRANGRSGAFLMIHGDCSSAGCYAMTDEQIAEIYALARESFFGGQRAFQIQAYPFRMTPTNVAKHRDSPHMPFWRMLKQGYDHFEVSRLEPKVDVCEKQYVFDAETNGKFSPAAKCPAYKVNEEIVAAVAEKEQRDDRQTAELVKQGTPTVPVRTGLDGGMHTTFLAAFRRPYTDSAGLIRSPWVKLPGTIPAHARPPGDPNAEPTTAGVAADASRGEARLASAPSSSQTGASGSLFGNLFPTAGSKEQPSIGNDQPKTGGVFERMSRFVGLGGSEAAAAEPASKPKHGPKATRTASVAKPKQASDSQPATRAGSAIHPEPKPAPQQEASTEPAARPASSASLLNGAQAPVPTGSFDSRWGGFR